MLQYKGGLRTSVHVARHGAYYQAFKLRIDTRIEVVQISRRGSRGGRATRQKVVESSSQGIYVGTRIGLALAKLLEGGICGGAHGHGVFALALFIGTCDAEVYQFKLPVGHYHDVGGLYVAENDGR